ncbi:hypothetical protein [Flectobacillus roseus]|uniref:hypothetical protein n=1 Tax=Flectobacillus roseus TaxID=502259 RepID=UPI0024B76BAD|nr:hypothetical protein [Flectobacillus roseus]MDI9872117.1 hypothetical protein [Flectobacillus roseus]
MTVVSFSNVDGTSHQAPNPGGIRKVYVALAKDIVGVWPNIKTDFTDGEITVLPTMKTGKKFAVYECPDGTVDASHSYTGEPGYSSYKHMINFSLAGHNKELSKEVKKHENAGSVYIVEENDGQHCVVGSTDVPIFLKHDLKTGKKGSDKRGYDFKGEADGFTFGFTPIKESLISTIPILPEE